MKNNDYFIRNNGEAEGHKNIVKTENYSMTQKHQDKQMY